MKRKIYVILLFVILFLVVIETKSLGYFEIDNFKINCYVQENGDIKIEENITYKTNESKNGVTRDIELKNDTNMKNSADGFLLETIKVDGINYTKTYNAQVGDSGVYEYTKTENKHSFKVYTPFKGKNKTVTYIYSLKNVVVKYKDTAELFWNFIGSKWDTNINNVDINIVLPPKATKGAIYVFGHGSDNGTFTRQGNYISLNARNLKAYQALDARILFSNISVPNSNKNINKMVLEKYINQEQGISEKREEREIFLGLSLNKIALGLSIIIIFSGIIIFFKYARKEKVVKQKYVREIPSNLEPELLQTVYYGKICKDAFWITFLNLVKLGVYRIEESTNEVGRKTQKIIFVKKIDGLKEHQQRVIASINGFMENNSIDIIKLKSEFKRSLNSGYKRFKETLNLRKEALFGEKIKVPKTVKNILYISIAILVIFISIMSYMVAEDKGNVMGVVMFLGMTTIIYTIMFKSIESNSFTIIFLLFHCGIFQIGNVTMLVYAGTEVLYIPYILLFVLIQIVERIKIQSKEELQIKEEIEGLRRYIKDYSMLEEKGIEYISLWEDYLILAIALGLNNKTINYFYDYCKENLTTEFSTSLVNIGTYKVMSNTFISTFNTYQASYTANVSSGSSYSGSSGGFSGGSSSGGSGRRWRRRKLFLNKN